MIGEECKWLQSTTREKGDAPTALSESRDEGERVATELVSMENPIRHYSRSPTQEQAPAELGSVERVIPGRAALEAPLTTSAETSSARGKIDSGFFRDGCQGRCLRMSTVAASSQASRAASPPWFVATSTAALRRGAIHTTA